MTWDDELERLERLHDRDHAEEERLDREVRHAPAPGRGIRPPEPPPGWHFAGDRIEPDDPSTRTSR